MIGFSGYREPRVDQWPAASLLLQMLSAALVPSAMELWSAIAYIREREYAINLVVIYYKPKNDGTYILQVHTSLDYFKAAIFDIRCTQTNRQTERLL